MTRTLQDALNWTEAGTNLCRQVLDSLDPEDFGDPSGLPEWTRKHVVAHLAGNAEGLGNLVSWARTGIETPMYVSQSARDEAIEEGAKRSPDELREWFDRSAAALDAAFSELTGEQWEREVRTRQGRLIAATQLPWLRAREVMVHAVDIDAGVGFADLPADFCTALRENIISTRGASQVPTVVGAPADITAWLAGRHYSGVTTASGEPAPPLPPWL
jgi:maleylpyruvate isomerase